MPNRSEDRNPRSNARMSKLVKPRQNLRREDGTQPLAVDQVGDVDAHQTMETPNSASSASRWNFCVQFI